MAKTFIDIAKGKGVQLPDGMEKYNHYHDARGRFSTADGAAFATLPKPGSNSKPKEMRETPGGGGSGSSEGQQESGEKKPSNSKPASRGHVENEENYDMEKELGISKEEAQKYKEAVYRYTDVGMYSSIRAVQTGEKQSAAIKKMGDDLEEYIEKAPIWDGGKLYRGIAADKETVDSLTKGSTIDMQGTSSWSSNQYTPKEFAAVGMADRSIIFTLPTTKKGTSVRHISSYKNQDEVIVSKTAKFKIKSKQDKKNYTEIELEEVE